MPKNNEPTTKFKVDISELKAGIQEANKNIKLANAEFKAASAGMDNWSKSSDGINAKLKQLGTVLDSQKAKLENYKKQQAEIDKAYAENGKRADELRAAMQQLADQGVSKTSQEYKALEKQLANVEKEQTANKTASDNMRVTILNQQAAVNKTEKEIRNYEKSLSDLTGEEKQTETAFEKLSRTISEQENKLRELKEKYVEIVATQGETGKEARNTAKEIAQLSSKLSANKSKLSEAESAADSLDKSFGNAGGAADKAGGNFTVLKGTLANLIAEGIKKCIEALAELTSDLINDSANAYAQFAAQTGTAADAMGKYETAIKNVYKQNFGESLQDVAEKMAKVKEVTGELDASKLEDMTKKAMTLEDTFGMDMVETLRGVNSLMTHFGMTSDEAFDLISSGAQNGLNYTDELGDNVSEYSGKFAEAGFTAEEYFQLLKNGAEGGAYNLDKVNDAVNEITTRLGDGTIADTMTAIDEKTGKVKDGTGIWSKETEKLFAAWQNGKATQKDVFASIVADIQGAKTEQEKMNLASKAFGTMAEDGGTKFIESLSSVGKSFTDVKGKADELAAVKYDTPAAAISGIGRTLKTDLLGPLADSLMPTLNNVAAWVTEKLPSFIEKIKNVASELEKWEPLIVGIGTAIATYFAVTQIQTFITWIKSGAAAIKMMEIAQAALNVVMNMNPIGLVISAIAGLVAAFVILWNKSDAFREFWINLWEKIKEVASTVWKAIEAFFSTAWEKIKSVWEKAKPYFETVWNAIKKIFSVVKEVLGKFFSTAWEKIKSIWDKVKPYFETIWNGIKKIFSVVKAILGAYFSTAWEAIKKVWDIVVAYFKIVWEGIKLVFSVVKEVLGGFFSTAWNAIKGVWDKVKPYFTAIWNGIKGTFSAVSKFFGNVFGSAWTAIKKAFSKVGSFFGGIWNTIKEKFSTIGTKVGDAIGGAFKTAINAVIATVERGINVIPNAINRAIGAINALPGVSISPMSTVSLPRLAKGGVLKKGQIGLLEGSGAEAVVPLEKNTAWLDEIAKRLSTKMNGNGMNSFNRNQVNNVSNNFYQTINSPEPLSRLEIYRQTKNQLALIRGG